MLNFLIEIASKNRNFEQIKLQTSKYHKHTYRFTYKRRHSKSQSRNYQRA